MSRRPLHAKIIDFFSDLYKSLRFSFHYLQEKKRFGAYYFPYSPLYKGETANILANGPSLNAELDDLMKEKASLENSLVVNYFAFSDLFKQIKPKFYCLADPFFFTEERYTDNVYRLFSELNKVSWKMNLFVWVQGADTIKKYVKNKNITIVGVSTLQFEGFESNRYKCYKKGYAVPSYINVTIMALYVLLNLGYSTIYLYGVDHSFLTGICVNDNNRLCLIDKHFYGTKMFEMPPRPNGILWHIKDFVYDKYLTFVEHEVMRGYADYLGAQIVNCTKESWIDAYVRKAQLEKQSE